MRRIAITAIIVILAGLLIGGLARWLWRSVSVPRRSGPISHSVYVWRRSWTDSVDASLQQTAPRMAGFVVLAAEVSWTPPGELAVVRISPDYEALRQTGKPVGLALRIGAYSGSFAPDTHAAEVLRKLATDVIADARQHGLQSAEMQIDFDCPESKLDGYRQWVAMLRREIAPVKLTITTLPCWLNQHSFADLVRSTDGFVLQVHSIDRPADVNADLVLCNPSAARDWVDRAGRVGVPFKVALPTYGYMVAFDDKGQFIGLNAEGPARSWPQGVTIRTVRADPQEMAGLVKTWEHSRPVNMEGLIWYRLPVKGDRLNWRWGTLSTVMRGKAPRHDLHSVAKYPEEGLVEVYLVNDGEADELTNVAIHLEWDDKGPLAFDGLNGFTIKQADPDGMYLQCSDPGGLRTIAPGESWKVGWLRFASQKEVRSHVSPMGS